MTNTIKILFFSLLSCLLFQTCQTDTLEKWDNYEALEKAFDWQKENTLHTDSTEWTDALYYAGLYRAHSSTQNKDYLETLVDIEKMKNWQIDKQQFNINKLPLCSSSLYLKNHGIRDVETLPIAQIINEHLFQNHCQESDNTLQPFILDWKSQDLFIVPPLLVAYAKEVNNYEYINQMNASYMQVYNLQFDTKEQLFKHHEHITTKSNHNGTSKKDFNLNDNGLIIAGLALILDHMPNDYKQRIFYEDLFRTMAHSLKNKQNKDGTWSSQLLKPDNATYDELTGSGLCTFAIAWGINSGRLDANEYQESIEKAWMTLRKYQQQDGSIAWYSNNMPINEQSNKPNIRNEATSAFLLAGSEIVQLKNHVLITENKINQGSKNDDAL